MQSDVSFSSFPQPLKLALLLRTIHNCNLVLSCIYHTELLVLALTPRKSLGDHLE